MLNFAGITDNSMVDYPGKMSAVIYLCGCDFRCPFCHNKEIVLNDETACKSIEMEDILPVIKDNFLIGGIVVTGGEPLIQEETLKLIEMLKEIKPVKLDTNGSYPDRLEKALPMLNFVAIDIKAPYEKYGLAIGISDVTKIIESVKKSISLLKSSSVNKEARTTIVPKINDSEEDMVKMCEIIKDVGFEIYTLQQFRPKNTLDPMYEAVPSPSHENLKKLAMIAKKNLPNVRIRLATIENGFEDIE